MTTLTITRGLPGSGKTTWAKAWAYNQQAPKPVRVNRDDTRFLLYGKYSGLSFPEEQMVTKIQQGQATQMLTEGFDVIIDDTNLNAKTVKGWQRLAQANNARFQNVDFPMGADECKKRVRRRVTEFGGRNVPDDVIDKMHNKYLRTGFPSIVPLEAPEALAEVYKPRPDLRSAYLFDVDGTLTTGPHNRSPYDWDKVGQDKVNEPVAALLAALKPDARIIVVSGRDGSCHHQTYRWLVENQIWFDQLHMREAGDTRKDAIVKAEIFNREIRNKWNVLGVFDDRNQVVEFWRSIGLTCFQVAEGKF